MKKFICIILSQLFAVSVFAEVVNPETGMDPRYNPVYTWRSAPVINEQIKKELSCLRSLPKKEHEYAYINKVNGHGTFTTYLVQISTGKIIDMFPSLIGYNGIGCGKGQTRPGLTTLTANVGQGASRKKWWGNNWKYFDIEPVKGVTRCHIDSELVVHSNMNLKGKDVDDKVKSKSAGCFVVPPDRLTQMNQYAGNAYIYNVNPKGTGCF